MPAELVLSAASWVWLRQPGRVIPDDPTPAAPPSEIAGTAVPTLPAPTPDVLLTPAPAGQIPFGAVPVNPVPAGAIPASPVPASAIPASAIPGSAIPGSAIPGSAIPGSAIPGSAIPTSQIPTSQPTTGAELQPTPYPAELAPAGSSWTWLWIVLLLAIVALTLVAGWWLWRFRGWGPDFGQPRRNRSGKFGGSVSLARPRVDVQAVPRRPRRFPPGTKLVNPWGQPSLTRLIDLGPQIRPQLSDCPLMLRWPSAPILDQDGLLISTQFSPPESTCTRVRTDSTRLDTLIRRSALDLDAQQRRDITIWIGRLIAEMHDAGWAMGTFDWESFHYCDQPTPHLHVTGIERARELGSEAAFALVPAKGWVDPRDGAILASFEQDRYRYALLIHRLLLASQPYATLGRRANSRSSARPSTDFAATSDRDYRSLRDLAGRAAGELYERPTIAEWLAVLQRRNRNLALPRGGPNPGVPTPHSPKYSPGDIR